MTAGELASIPARIAARGVDLVLLFGGALFTAVEVDDPALNFPLYLLTGLAGLFQDLAGTALAGQSLGKRLLRIRVVREEDGGPPGWERAFLRSWVGYLFAPGFFRALSDDERRQGAHDRAAGTLVVKA